ncbi:MAG: L,D-transpeptidase, partial [Actinobacteria bacterium]|nr:L,D-transpeptidase [Actinomycetota bacterium]
AAPWSVPDQGQRNVSHGCINLSTADAQWFYDFTQRGDIIDIHSAGAAPDLADPGTMDWNLSWEAWNSA